MAHADDAELWAGGTLAAHARAGGRTVVAVPRSNATRDGEAEAGAKLLGAECELLDDLATHTVADLLTRLQPDAVITHSPEDIHPAHRTTATTLLAVLPEVVIANGRPARVYHCDGYNGLDMYGRPLHLPVIVDVSATWDLKQRAACAHASQPITSHFWPMVETLGRLHGMRTGTTYAEAFQPMPVLGRLPAADGL
ncbi:PIG-L deacetylase family protein [Catellatospora citrea]|nr:PIG-L family deacetylase [Catellatospora citrea]